MLRTLSKTPSHPLPDGLALLTSNEYLVLAGTLHGIHAITSRLSPMGSSSGVQVIEGESFKINIFLTVTGEFMLQRSNLFNKMNK